MSTITMTTEQFEAAVRKEVLAQTGNQSVKSLKKDQPKIDISTREKLLAAFEASGHVVSTDFIAGYAPPAIGKKDQPIGGYGFLSSSEKLGWDQKAAVWMKTSGLSGLASLDKIQENIGHIRERLAVLKDAVDMLQDVEAGFTAVYKTMTEQTEK